MIRKKGLCITIVLLIVLVIAVLLVIYNKQEHIVLSKRFYIPIEKNTDIIYLDNQNGKDSYCDIGLKIRDSDYEKIILDMQKANYHAQPLEEYKIFLLNTSDWVPVENITEVYTLNTVKYSFISGYRIHIVAFITESSDGYREIYITRN